jgi:hypothetical protein
MVVDVLRVESQLSTFLRVESHIRHVDEVRAILIARMDPFLKKVVDIESDRTYGHILIRLATQRPRRAATRRIWNTC